jgi:hypothetical protein
MFDESTDLVMLNLVHLLQSNGFVPVRKTDKLTTNKRHLL